MARKNVSFPQGRLTMVEHTSKVLADNPLGDPSVRRVGVWLPPQYEGGEGSTHKRGRARRFPVLYDLVGFTGSGLAHMNWRPFDENVPERAARLVHEGRMAPAIIVFPDCFTSMGGNQYINSSAIGRYADYLTREIVPFIDREFRTLASRDHRGCFGKSSGGYGSIIHGMKYPETWGAIADHSGDASFDLCYLTDWPRTLNELDRYRGRRRREGKVDAVRDAELSADGIDDGRVRRFLDAMWDKERPSDGEVHAIMELAMAASYDPDRQAPNGFRLPINLETGELLPKRWAKWLEHDPVQLVSTYAKNLRTLRGIYIDCGWRDQYHLHYGARLLSKRLTEHRVAHTYEEFDDTHSSIDYRMDESLPFLTRALK